MANKISIERVNGKPNYPDQYDYIMTEDDVTTLPTSTTTGVAFDGTVLKKCAIGSTATYSNGNETKIYVLFPNNEWIKL